MKREILFKGFSHKYKSWITGIYCLDVNYSNEVYTCIQVVNRSAEGEILNIGRYEVDPKTVCQYTGLKDKNGVKIFEGDIFYDTDLVDNSPKGEMKTYKGETIGWSYDKSAFMLDGDTPFCYVKIEKGEVIGNSYDSN